MAARGERWYRQPVLWLAVAILLASITVYIGVIVLALRNPDVPLTQGERVLRVPVARDAPPAP